MWRWAKRWIDWVRNDLIPLARVRRGGHVVLIRYDAAGRSHIELPVPWSADAVVVEVVLRLPHAARRKADLVLRIPGQSVVVAESVRPDVNDRHRVTFRFPVPMLSVAGEFQWKHRTIALVGIPVLTADAFLGALTVGTPTVAVRLGGHVVAARAFVAEESRGLVASALLHSPYRLESLVDLNPVVEFRNETTGRVFAVPVTLTAEQGRGHETLVTAICPKVPRRPGWWSVAWRVGDRMLATTRLEVIAARRFEEVVRVLDARFAVAGKDGVVRVLQTPPAMGAYERVGPCFLVLGGEPGAAALCRMAVFAIAAGSLLPTPLLERELLVTDAPTVFAPGLLEAADLARVGGFELRLNGRILGTASLSPVPPATLTSEGGFKPPPDFSWTAAAEEELQERLGRLGGNS